MTDANPFFSPSTLPYTLPAFADIRIEHYGPAFERGLSEQRAEIDAVTADPSEPTVENTLLPLERSGQLLDRVASVFFNVSSADSDDDIRALDERLAPVLSAHADSIRLDPALVDRLSRLQATLPGDADAETRYLLERYVTGFRLAGALLDDDAKVRLRDYNSRLSTLSTRFENALLADTNDLAVIVRNRSELDGLSDDDISAAAQAAADRGIDDAWVITLVLPTGHPYLASLTDRRVRRRIMDASRSRGCRGGEHDTSQLVADIVSLRAERAGLLGFDSHAAWVTADQTARTPDAVADMLHALAPAAASNARREKAELERTAGHEIEAWDWAYFSERLRSESLDVDAAALRPYLEADRVLRDGVFFAATRLYGVTFTERTDLVGYHPDVRVFEVRNEDGSELGLYLLDLYTRDSKRGGAWMNSLSSQSRLLGHPPIVVNNLNVPKPAAGEPTLLTLDLTTTLFHEFGHALHGLFSDVTYPRFSGTSVYRDFVEFPSQVNEMWMLWPDVLANYAVHHETGQPLPVTLADALRASDSYGQGFATSEYLAASLLDQAWHRLAPHEVVNAADLAAFETSALTDAGLNDPAVPTRYSSTYFAHIFSGGYSAGYYSYIWSEVLDADTVGWFRDNGGLSRAAGDRFRELVLGVGGSKDPLEAYREFRGRDAVLGPLLERRGLN